jgi:hypothetical protein
MGPSDKAFQQVRSILGKLDRSVDQIRAQRTQPPLPPKPVAPPERTAPGSNAAPAIPQRPASAFGRATPIPPSGG